MAWIDDRIWCHPKVVGVPKATRWVYAASIAYSAGFQTAGELDRGQQTIIGTEPKDRRALIDAGLWDDLGDGRVRVHDWDEHNSKRDARKAADRERKKRAYWAEKGQEPPQETPPENTRRNRGETGRAARVEARAGARPMTNEGTTPKAVPAPRPPAHAPEANRTAPDFTKEEPNTYDFTLPDIQPNLRSVT